MSQMAISAYLIQLYETESRIVDQLLSQPQTKETLQKPRRFHNRRLPAAAECIALDKTHCDYTGFPWNTRDHDPSRLVTTSRQYRTAQEMFPLKRNQTNTDSSAVNFTEESFTVQDPVSTCVDTLYFHTLRSAQQKPKLRKPEWLQIRLNKMLLKTDQIQPESRNGGISTKSMDSSNQHRIEWTPETSQDTDRNGAPSGCNSSQRYYFRQPKSSSAKRKLSEFLTSKQTTTTVTPSVTDSVSSALKLSVPVANDSGLVKDTLSWKRPGKQPFSASRRKDSSVGDNDDAGWSDVSATSSSKCEVYFPKAKRRKISHYDPTIKSPGLETEPSKGKRLSPLELTCKQKLRRGKRCILGRSLNLQCVSCKHGIIISECLICSGASLKTVNRSVKSVSSVRAVKKSVKTVNKSVRPVGKLAKKVNKSIKTGSRSAKNVHNCVKKSVKLVKKSVKLVRKSVKAVNNPTKSGNKSTVNNLLKTAKKTQSAGQAVNSGKLTSKHKKPLGQKSRHKNTAEVHVQKQSSSRPKEKVSLQHQKNTCKTVKEQIYPKQQNGMHKNTQSLKTNLKPSKYKGKTSQEKQSEPSANSIEMSILERHRHLSSQTSSLNSSQAFSSTRDMFSQLCQLEERSKQYDASTLETVMPDKQISGENVSKKALSVYSSSLHSSHVGGIWKSIFSER